VYQETYHRDVYKQYHTKGKKSNFDFRLDTPDRVGTAGIHKIGLGVYWIRRLCTDSFFNALHLDYLQKRIGKLNMRFLSPDCDRQKELSLTIMDDSDLTQLILPTVCGMKI
jgi:2-iminoacetate synthase